MAWPRYSGSECCCSRPDFRRSPRFAGWQVEPDRLLTTDPHAGRRLYSKVFNAGTVTLGGNRDSAMPGGLHMYSVILVPEAYNPNSEAREWSLYE